MEREQQVLMTGTQEEKQREGERSDGQQTKQQAQLNLAGCSSPPSASASPTHEFSFTISLNPPTAATTEIPDKSKSPPPFAIDLSPADEIFFHGHLLPLHLLSHLPASPRSSTNSLDSFSIPINELPEKNNNNNNDELPEDNDDNSSTGFTRSDNQYINTDHLRCEEGSLLKGKGRGKSKSFSLFGLPRWRKGCEAREKDDQQDRHKRKLKLDVSHVVKRYMRLVKPLLSFGNRRGNPQIHRQQPYSFSGNLQMRNKKELRGRKGEFSAPVSTRTSPTNSGLLVASGALTPTTSDSTMEELQAAIQAAIAHCKKSIAAEDTVKPP